MPWLVPGSRLLNCSLGSVELNTAGSEAPGTEGMIFHYKQHTCSSQKGAPLGQPVSTMLHPQSMASIDFYKTGVQDCWWGRVKQKQRAGMGRMNSCLEQTAPLLILAETQGWEENMC